MKRLLARYLRKAGRVACSDMREELIAKQTELRVQTERLVLDQSKALEQITQKLDAAMAPIDQHAEKWIGADTDMAQHLDQVSCKVAALEKEVKEAITLLKEQQTTRLSSIAQQEKIAQQTGGLLSSWRDVQAKKADLRHVLQGQATQQTAEYIREAMSHVQSVDHKFKVIDIALDHSKLTGGLALEFGVLTGRTINYIAEKRPNWTVDGFDSFEGLPEAWRDGYAAGHFRQDQLPEVAENVHLHKGWFDDSLPKYLAEDQRAKKPVTFLHVDCDLYSSTKTIFRELKDQLIVGSVIVFDEYFNYDGWKVGEFQAFQEFLSETNLGYEYLTYNRKHEQVAVILT